MGRTVGPTTPAATTATPTSPATAPSGTRRDDRRRRATAAAGNILWFVKSDPPRADVVRIDDGAVLGHTPWYVERPRAGGSVAAMVRKAGYADELITLDRGANTTIHVRLTRRASSGKSHAPSGDKRHAEEDDLDVKPLK